MEFYITIYANPNYRHLIPHSFKIKIKVQLQFIKNLNLKQMAYYQLGMDKKSYTRKYDFFTDFFIHKNSRLFRILTNYNLVQDLDQIQSCLGFRPNKSCLGFRPNTILFRFLTKYNIVQDLNQLKSCLGFGPNTILFRIQTKYNLVQDFNQIQSCSGFRPNTILFRIQTKYNLVQNLDQIQQCLGF